MWWNEEEGRCICSGMVELWPIGGIPIGFLDKNDIKRVQSVQVSEKRSDRCCTEKKHSRLRRLTSTARQS